MWIYVGKQGCTSKIFCLLARGFKWRLILGNSGKINGFSAISDVSCDLRYCVLWNMYPIRTVSLLQFKDIYCIEAF